MYFYELLVSAGKLFLMYITCILFYCELFWLLLILIQINLSVVFFINFLFSEIFLTLDMNILLSFSFNCNMLDSS